MSSRSIGVQTTAMVLAAALCGCSAVGLGYRANQARSGTGRGEAERLSQLAELYEQQGHSAGAMRLYRQALQADPRSQQASERLMALSSQHAAPPQAPPVGNPALNAAATPLLAQNARQSAGAPQVAAAIPSDPRLALSGGSPALAPEPPKTPIRAAATPRPEAGTAQPMPVVPSSKPGSVIADSASAVAAAAAPILALMSPPTGDLSFLSEHDAEHEVALVETAPPPMAEAPVATKAAAVNGEPAPLIQPAPAPQSAPAPLNTESTAKLAIVTLPPLPQPVERQSTLSSVDWTSSRVAAADAAPAPVTNPAPANSGIAIRPQSASEEVLGRAVLNPTSWSRTDPTRLSPAASEELLAIVRRLESTEVTVRKDALIELAELSAEAKPVAAAVRSLFHDPDACVQAHAAWADYRISGVSEECVSVLSTVVQSNEPTGATFAAYCLGLLEVEAAEAVPALQTACGSEIGPVRLCAAEALLKITPDAAEPIATLIDGLRDPSPEHRWLAALSLSAASSAYQESAILALIPVLNDAEAAVCSSAALALGAYGPAAATAAPDLEAALSHADADVRDAASAALECIVP